MQTRLENRLSRLKAPDAPKDLKARCLATIPMSVRDDQRSTNASPMHRPFAFPKIAAMVALMLSTAAVAAFWNTRPVGDKTIEPSGSVAFAQTVEAMKRVTALHIRLKSPEGTYLTNRTWFYSECWVDVERGSFFVSNYRSHNNHDPIFDVFSVKSRSADSNTPFDRELQLPDGTIYTRKANSRVLIIKTDPKRWKRTLEDIASIATGDFKSFTKLGRETQLVSSTLGNWKGQQARIFVFQEKGTPATKYQKARIMRIKFYVDPATKRMIGMELLVIYVNHPERVTQEIQFDYQKPAPEYFDPTSLKKGATFIRPKPLKRGKTAPQ